jgi:tryptophanase
MAVVRLANPRRVYTQSHVDDVVETTLAVRERRGEIAGLRIAKQQEVLRQFALEFEPLYEVGTILRRNSTAAASTASR